MHKMPSKMSTKTVKHCHETTKKEKEERLARYPVKEAAFNDKTWKDSMDQRNLGSG